MDIFEKIRKYENLHIVFWLLKDTCWMLELKWLGALMVVPTVSLCIWIIYKTKGLTEMYINWAILFWICANSFWMLSEFFNHANYKLYAAFPFAMGFVFVAVFYIKSGLRGNANKESL